MTKLQENYREYELNYYAEILASNGMSLDSARRLLMQGEILLGWNLEQVFDKLNANTLNKVGA